MRNKYVPRTLTTLGIVTALAVVMASCSNQHSGEDTAMNATREISTGQVRGADGASIAYETRGAGDTALVFVHGWSCDRTYWREQLGAFSDDYQVIAVDLAGHGESGDERDQFSMESFGADVAAVIEQLSVDRVILVGHSMGGPVVVEAAAQMDDRVVGVIGVDTLKHVDQRRLTPEQRQKMSAAMEADFDTALRGFVRSTMFSEHSPPDLTNWIVDDMAQTNRRVARLAGDSMVSVDFDARLQEIKNTPLHLINSDYQETSEAALRVSHPGAQVVYIEKAGHFLMLERPEVFNSALRELLATL